MLYHIDVISTFMNVVAVASVQLLRIGTFCIDFYYPFEFQVFSSNESKISIHLFDLRISAFYFHLEQSFVGKMDSKYKLPYPILLSKLFITATNSNGSFRQENNSLNH